MCPALLLNIVSLSIFFSFHLVGPHHALKDVGREGRDSHEDVDETIARHMPVVLKAGLESVRTERTLHNKHTCTLPTRYCPSTRLTQFQDEISVSEYCNRTMFVSNGWLEVMLA